MFREDRFRKLLQEKRVTLQEVAQILEINTSTLYRKMTGESDFYRSEIQKICEKLEIENPTEIFFAE